MLWQHSTKWYGMCHPENKLEVFFMSQEPFSLWASSVWPDLLPPSSLSLLGFLFVLWGWQAGFYLRTFACLFPFASSTLLPKCTTVFSRLRWVLVQMHHISFSVILSKTAPLSFCVLLLCFRVLQWHTRQLASQMLGMRSVSDLGCFGLRILTYAQWNILGLGAKSNKHEIDLHFKCTHRLG